MLGRPHPFAQAAAVNRADPSPKATSFRPPKKLLLILGGLFVLVIVLVMALNTAPDNPVQPPPPPPGEESQLPSGPNENSGDDDVPF